MLWLASFPASALEGEIGEDLSQGILANDKAMAECSLAPRPPKRLGMRLDDVVQQSYLAISYLFKVCGS